MNISGWVVKNDFFAGEHDLGKNLEMLDLVAGMKFAGKSGCVKAMATVQEHD